MTDFEFEEAVRESVNHAMPESGEGKSWTFNGRTAVLSCQDGTAYIHLHILGARTLADGSAQTFFRHVVTMPTLAKNVERASREIVSHLRA